MRGGFGVVVAVWLLAGAAFADTLSFDGHVTQGGLVVGRTAPGTTIRLDGRAVRVSPDGLFLLAFARDAGPTAQLIAEFPDGRREARALTVARRTFAVQRIDGLPSRQVSPSAADMARIQTDTALIAQARAADTDAADFRSGFVWPVQGPISGVFGSQRILNGEPRAPHYGTDIVVPAGTPIAAVADGRVVLSERDMFFTGKTVMIDHGHGLTSVYAHMSELAVTVGTRVAKGQIIGRVGATGRVTAPHLHWGMAVFTTQIDPQLLVAPAVATK